MKRLSLVLLIALLCATSTLAKEPQERIAYYTVEGSSVTVYFLDPETRTTTQQHAFDLKAGEKISSASPAGDQILFTVVDSDGEISKRLWTPSDGMGIEQEAAFNPGVWSFDRRFLALCRANYQARQHTITIQDTWTHTQHTLIMGAASVNCEIAWAHHSNVLTTSNTQCTGQDCRDSELLIIDAQTGTTLRSIAWTQSSYNMDLDYHPCRFDWSPDDQTIAFLYPCSSSRTNISGEIYIQKLDDSQTSTSVISQWRDARRLGFISHSGRIWLDATHIVVGSIGYSPSADGPNTSDARTLATYLYDLETDALTPFLDRYTVEWKEIQPGFFLYRVYEFSAHVPFNTASYVEHLELARFDGTTAVILSTLPSGHAITASESGVFAAYIIGPDPSAENDIIGIVSVQDASFSTYVTPQDNTHFIGWVSTAP